MTNKDDDRSNELSLASLGESLRLQREGKGLALQDCAEQLKIRHRYLESLEQGHPDELPGDVFYINFVKSYATLLGFSGEEFAGKARKAMQAQGRLKELESVMQHRAVQKADKAKVLHVDGASVLASTLAANLATSLGEGEAARVSSVSLAGKLSATASLQSAFLASPIANLDTEKQLLRERLVSPLFVGGALIGVVLLYLGTVIVTDLMDDGGGVVSTESSITLEVEEQSPEVETLVEVVEDTRTPKIYGVSGASRIEVWAKETCWIAVFATDISLGRREQAELLFAETLLEGDSYRVPAELGIILKGGNLSCLTFVVQGVVTDPFRIQNPSGFMSLEPSHLRTRTAVREGGVLARERLSVVLEIELLRQQRAERARELEGGNP